MGGGVVPAPDRPGGRHATPRGRAEQVDPLKSILKTPGPMLLKLTYDGLYSKPAFNFNLRRSTEVGAILKASGNAITRWGGAG